MMDDQAREEYELQSQKLRTELKQWENDWVKTKGGGKPTREDIKQNRNIAKKYKDYNKLRDILSGKIPPPAPPRRNDADHKQRKRKQEEGMMLPSQTPQKRPKHTATPLKSQLDTDHLFSAVTPSLSRRLFSPSVPTSIGPTPQRDGRVLGLFDLLSATPSRSTNGEPRPLPIDATPSKRNSNKTPPEQDTLTTPRANRLSRTPSSSRNRNRLLLDEFMGITTPLHKRDHNSQQLNKTPSSSRSSMSKLQFATPAFLRRTAAPLPPVDENGEWKVEPIKLPRKPLVRGLSSVVASLRKLEEETLDDELDAMREMEMEGGEPMFAAPRKANSPPAAAGNPGEEEEKGETAAQQESTNPGEDTAAANNHQQQQQEKQQQQQQRPEKPLLLGGFDDEDLYESQAEEQLDRGQPLRVFKKKGQKRTTRRVNMRPARIRRPNNPNDDDGDEDEQEEGDTVLPETQFDSTKLATHDGENLLNDDSDPLSGAGGSDSEFGDGGLGDDSNDDDDYDDDDDDMKEKKATKSAAAQQPKTSKGKKDKGAGKDKGNKEKEEGLVKKAVRKVKATAHANFKRLKLKNTGSKGGPGYNSRFRRRR